MVFNYRQNEEILSEIKKASNILVSTHKNPDYDSIASAMALKYVLGKMGKKVTVVSCQKINSHFDFIKNANTIDFIDFKNFTDFRLYDLFIVPDTASVDRVTGSKDIGLPDNLKTIIIDHHKTNIFSNGLRLLEEKASATCEMLYQIFVDWGINIDETLATLLMTGIMGDTVFLRYGENNKKTFGIVADLVEKGADKDLIQQNFYEKYDFNYVKLLGEFLNTIKLERGGGRDFVWSAIPFEVYEKYEKPEGVREMAADLFFRGIKDSDFGVAILESKKDVLNMSFRSKKGTDVSKIAKLFGGGGHIQAAGATVYGEFSKTVKNIIKNIVTAA